MVETTARTSLPKSPQRGEPPSGESYGYAARAPVACGGASTAGGFPSVGIWRWKPPAALDSPHDASLHCGKITLEQ
ncbi:hypothetical protein BZZ01_28490 [Nostocales cyanobacterium HT-58-2]|nr:hypothetical protein BZZ01_28490 [Nostocales cyanobacterium HT-58-2]